MSQSHREIPWNFDNTYTRLPGEFFVRVRPALAPSPRVVLYNEALGDELGISLRDVSGEHAAAVFSGQAIPPGADPIAQAYAGHQFGGFTILGDGRAILLGEHRSPQGRRVDVQLKGSGPTAFSRGGDGLAALGPMLREYIISEAMYALGISTTRSLAVVATGSTVMRETLLPGAILTRIAASHIRVGTFQYAASCGDTPLLRQLADYTISRHFSELSERPDRYLAFLKAMIDRQAFLIAQWQLIGFVHGVMNTDNMAISGETIDYGPCAFMDAYDIKTVFSSIDRSGRYAYGNQPTIAQWNLARFAETLLPLLDSSEDGAVATATEAVMDFTSQYQAYWMIGMRRKLGLLTADDEDQSLAETLLLMMQEARADFTKTFRDLSMDPLPDLDLFRTKAFRDWLDRWNAHRARDGQRAASVAMMRSANPQVIPRNHRVEEALAASHNGDYQPLRQLMAALRSPYEVTAPNSKYVEPPIDGAVGYRTFCGT